MPSRAMSTGASRSCWRSAVGAGRSSAPARPPISGALIHYAKGNVIPSIALWLAIGATVGAYVTGHWVRFIPSGTLRTLFGIFLVIVGVWMVGRRRKIAAGE